MKVGNYYSHQKLTESGFSLIAENHTATVAVYMDGTESNYWVFHNNILRHPNIHADGAIRALTQYVK